MAVVAGAIQTTIANHCAAAVRRTGHCRHHPKHKGYA